MPMTLKRMTHALGVGVAHQTPLVQAWSTRAKGSKVSTTLLPAAFSPCPLSRRVDRRTFVLRSGDPLKRLSNPGLIDRAREQGIASRLQDTPGFLTPPQTGQRHAPQVESFAILRQSSEEVVKCH